MMSTTNGLLDLYKPQLADKIKNSIPLFAENYQKIDDAFLEVEEIIEEITLTEDTAIIEFDNLPLGYKRLKLISEASHKHSIDTRLTAFIKLNDDETNYNSINTNQTFTSSGASSGVSETRINNLSLCWERGYGESIIYNYNIERKTVILSQGFAMVKGSSSSQSSNVQFSARGIYLLNSIVNKITYTMTQDFAAGSKFTLIGVK